MFPGFPARISDMRNRFSALSVEGEQSKFPATTLHTAGAREIWIDQSGFSRREKF